MDWNDVRLIAEIGRTGSFTGAAAVLAGQLKSISLAKMLPRLMWSQELT